ncbi:PQ loop repeat protein [Pyricularia oryzae Y34]|uniref:PQ loop repeat protein n=2 Tax=Pyricularia oryzae TaxID=318829 RepID=A0AA97PKA4_PYRO3|nr:PQ loop repeat protein [Pyricularia oryzae Y34]
MDAFWVAASSRCEELRSPGPINLIVSIFILVGMLISYLPQHYRIISRGTSEGISPYFVLLGVTSATSGFANILTLPQSRQDVTCCKDLDTFHCLAGLLGIAQLGVQWICFAVILVLFLVFFRYGDTTIPDEEELPDEAQPKWQTAVMVAVIWTTYHLKHVGSLSIPMMCIQTPGGYLFAGSLFARLGWAGWSSWGIFLLTATMQGVLLCMGIYYEISRGKEKARAEATNGTHPHGDSEDSERDDDPLATPPHGGRAAYTPGLDEGVPRLYTAHPEHYANTPEELQGILDRQEADAAAETQPLLKPGGIGTPYNT